MSLKQFFFLLISLLLFVSACWGQNGFEYKNKFNLVAQKPVPKIERQSFKVTFTDSWFGKDKVDHFLVSSFLTAGSFYLIKEEQNLSQQKSMILSIGFAFSLGIAKEIRDGLMRSNAASVKDVVADILGIGIGVFLFNIE